MCKLSVNRIIHFIRSARLQRYFQCIYIAKCVFSATLNAACILYYANYSVLSVHRYKHCYDYPREKDKSLKMLRHSHIGGKVMKFSPTDFPSQRPETPRDSTLGNGR